MNRNNKDKSENNYFNLEDLRYYHSLSAKKKLEYLEEMLIFLNKITPIESKNKWAKLKSTGLF